MRDLHQILIAAGGADKQVQQLQVGDRILGHLEDPTSIQEVVGIERGPISIRVTWSTLKKVSWSKDYRKGLIFYGVFNTGPGGEGLAQ